MSESVQESDKDKDEEKAKAIAATTLRLERLLYVTRQDEARLKRILELRRLKRRLRDLEERSSR